MSVSWQAFIQPDSVELDPGHSQVVFVSFTIPTHTAAGVYDLSFSAIPSGHDAEPVAVDITVNVAGFHYLDIRQAGGNKSNAASGDVLQLVFDIINMGNTPGQVAIEAKSFPEWPVTINSEDLEFDLEPAQGHQILITVETPGALGTLINHRLSITARIVDVDEDGDEAQTSVTTVIYPNQLSGSIYATLDGETSMQVSIDDDGEGISLLLEKTGGVAVRSRLPAEQRSVSG